MLTSTLRRGSLLAALAVLGFLLSAATPANSLARHRRSGIAVRTTSHSAHIHGRHAKLSRKHRHASRPLSASEKASIIDQIKSVAHAEAIPDQPEAVSEVSPLHDSLLNNAQLAELEQAAAEELAEDDYSVAMDKFLSQKDATSVAVDPDAARDRERDFTLFSSNDPRVSASRTDVMQNIINWVGTRYRFGGDSQKGIDCSAFTRDVFRKSFNVDLPRTAAMQSVLGTHVGKSKLQFGDLVFFKTARYAPVTHVGIYVGEGLFANASSSRGVTVASIESPYWAKKFLFAKRLFTNAATAQAEVNKELHYALISGELPANYHDFD